MIQIWKVLFDMFENRSRNESLSETMEAGKSWKVQW